MRIDPEAYTHITGKIVAAAIKVHRALEPRLLESIYILCFVEIKSIAVILPVHESQLQTYLRITGCPVGQLINFNVPVLKDGVKRRLNPRATLTGTEGTGITG